MTKDEQNEAMRKALQQIINVTKGSKAYTAGAVAHYIAYSTLQAVKEGERMTKDHKEPDSADKLVSRVSLGIITRSTILTTIVTILVIGGVIIVESISN